VDVIPRRLGQQAQRKSIGRDGDDLDGVVSLDRGDHERDGGVVGALGEGNAQRMDPASIVRRAEGGALGLEDRREGSELGGRGDARGVADVLGVRDPRGEVGGRRFTRSIAPGRRRPTFDAAVG
jgi:hypothetical protein